eukprot:259007-Pelagomonas_calceolata.AAC.2
MPGLGQAKVCTMTIPMPRAIGEQGGRSLDLQESLRFQSSNSDQCAFSMEGHITFRLTCIHKAPWGEGDTPKGDWAVSQACTLTI